MKISYNWLKQYIDVDMDAQEVSDILTDIGLEVEKTEQVESIPGGLRGLVIGEVISKEQHPNADRLSVTSVNIGAEEPQQIVCGAPNVMAGQKVVVATPGTTIYPTEGDSFKIKKSKIRGVESLGMICAEDEIGLGKSHDGIMVLDSNAEIGLAANRYFELEDDIIFEIGLTPNRADGMSHIGVARDLMVALKFRNLIDQNATLNIPDITGYAKDNDNLIVEISVEDYDACPRYAGVTISNVQVGPSPDWLQNRLRSIGLGPINNVVDITNFVLHEMGQPLHAFDAEVVNGKVIVKQLPEGTKFTTLDEVERELSNKDLMICNETGGMCIAGVFGGIQSGVSEQTQNIFLESAYFNPVSVRKTAKRHGLNTDASFRFERGIDPNITIQALKRAALLIKEIAGGEISSDITDLYPTAIEDFTFDVNLNRVRTLCGVQFKQEEIEEILSLLEIEILENNGENLCIKVPAYRVDVQREADIAEEVLRIYGFNNIPIPEKLNSSLAHRPKIDKEWLQNMVSDLLASMGLTEAMSNSLTKSDYVAKAGASHLKEEFNVEMLNPLSSDLNVMRQSLLFNGLEAIRLNQNHGNSRVKLFEFGKIYQKFESGYQENQMLSLYLSGARSEETWNGSNSDVGFYTLKSLVEGILKRLGVWKNYHIGGTKNELFEDGLTYKIAKKKVVEFGWVRNNLKNQFDIKKDVFYAEFNWDVLMELTVMNKVKFKELPKFPAVTRDLSLLLDDAVKFEEIAAIAQQCDKRLLKEVALFDVYKDKGMETGKKSYAVRFVLQDENKTLRDKDIDKVMGKIQDSVINKLGAQLR